MVGSMTPLQKTATYRRCDGRVPRLKAWYGSNNDLFGTVHREGYVQTQVVLERSNELADATAIAGSQELDRECARFNAPDPSYNNVSDDDETTTQAATALLTYYDDGDEANQTRYVLNKQNQKKKVIVRRSSSIISDFDKPFWVHAFVELLPFGRGGLDERRKIDIALEWKSIFGTAFGYLLGDAQRIMLAFDVLARHHAMQAIYLRARLSPSSVATSAAVRREELLEYLKQREHRLRNYCRYYDAVISIFVNLMLNYDQSKQLPRAGMGIFGVTKAFYVSTESQNSTRDVHGHMLIWIDGMPTTTAEYYEMLEMIRFESESGCMFRPLPVPASLSIFIVSEVSITWSYCTAISKESFTRGYERCATEFCFLCTEEFGASDLAEMEIDREADLLALPCDRLSDKAVHRRVAMPQPLVLSPQCSTEEAWLP
ncbi:hypothetical protein GQ600_5978 [Phytophthora cactorum]|nr:hypothetical protein GQ600_5978 [Phytophthora cactorum]